MKRNFIYTGLSAAAFTFLIYLWAGAFRALIGPAGNGNKEQPAAVPNRRESATPRTSPLRPEVLEVSGRSFVNPRAAWEYALQLPQAEGLPALFTVADYWARSCSNEAVACAAELEDEETRREVLARIGLVLLAGSPPAALKLADKLPEAASKEALHRTLIQGWAKQNPAAAAQWVRDQVSDPSNTLSLQTIIGIEWAQKNPEAAATFVAEAMEPSEAQEQAALTVAMRWAHLDFAKASIWVGSFPDPEVRDKVMRAVSSLAPEQAQHFDP